MRPMPELIDEADQLVSPPDADEMRPFRDIPGGVWKAFLGAWGILFGLFILVFTTDGRATLDVFTAGFFALMTLGLPAALCTQSKCPPRPWPRTVTTHTGPLPTSAAATQILLIPVGAIVGLTAFILLVM
ncbi:MAG TPA: hypothetical protein VF027_04805 [Sphingomicrobium sp.]